MIEFLFLCLANTAISYTISRSMFFEPIRNWFFLRDHKSNIYKFIHNMISCTYCLSHWVAFAMVLLWQPTFTQCNILPFADYIISAFSMITITTLLWSTIDKLT